MEDTNDTPITTTKDGISSHGVRMKDSDWAKWQAIVSGYTSGAEAFGEVIAVAQMLSIGARAGMEAKAKMVADHSKQINEIFTDLLQTMADQSNLAAEKLASIEQANKAQAEAAAAEVAKAKAAVAEAQAAAATAEDLRADMEQSRAAVRMERNELERQLGETRKDLEDSRGMREQALAEVAAARTEVQALREQSDKDRATIADLRDQLAAAKADIVAEQSARVMADERVKSLTDQIGTKDRLIEALQNHLTTLGHPADSQNTTPETTA